MSESASLSPVPTLVNESISKRHSTARRYALLVIFFLGEFPSIFIASAMFPAIPFLVAALHVSESNLTWIINASKLTFSSFLLISGRISDIYDPKLTFICGVVVSGILPIGTGFATNTMSLIIIRVLDGIADSLVIPSTLKLLVNLFPDPTEQARAIGLFMGCGSVAAVIGFNIGAALLQFAKWSWVFWLPAIVALPTAVVGIFLIPEATKQDNDNGNPNAPIIAKWKRLDLLGVCILSAAVMLFVFVITSGSNSGWGSAKIIAPLIISVLMFVGFFYYETRIPSSIAAIPPSTWFLPNFSILIGVALPPSLWETTVLLAFSTLWKEVYHWSTTAIALRLIPVAILTIAISFTGPLSRTINPKWILLFAQGTIIIATILLHFADAPDRYFPFVIPAFILGATGTALSYTHTNIAIFRTSPASMAGTVGAIFNSAVQLGSVVGLAVVSSIQTGVEVKHGGPTGYTGRAAVLWFLLGFVCIGAVILLVFYRTEAERNDHPEDETNSGSELPLPVEEVTGKEKVSVERSEEPGKPEV